MRGGLPLGTGLEPPRGGGGGGVAPGDHLCLCLLVPLFVFPFVYLEPPRGGGGGGLEEHQVTNFFSFFVFVYLVFVYDRGSTRWPCGIFFVLLVFCLTFVRQHNQIHVIFSLFVVFVYLSCLHVIIYVFIRLRVCFSLNKEEQKYDIICYYPQ